MLALAQATAGAAASAASRPMTTPPPTVSLSLDGATVKTANGQSWLLTIAAQTGTSEMMIELARTVAPSGEELHSWSFPVKAGTFKFSTSSGDGTVDPGSQTSPTAKVDLTFKATAHSAGACSSGSETIYTGTLTGEAELVTGLTAGGTVGGSSVSFTAKGSTPTVAVDNDCIPASTETCVASIVWGDNGGAEPAVVVDGISGTITGKKVDLVEVSKDTDLTSPKGADRTDLAVENAAPAVWTASTKTLSVTTPADGLVTGSVTLKVGKESTESVPCSNGTKKYTETLSADQSATWTSPAGKAITAHTSLTGNLVAPTSLKTGLFIQTTLKAA
jgi:3D (Asp-Asp-Asp) domain-containing protein